MQPVLLFQTLIGDLRFMFKPFHCFLLVSNLISEPNKLKYYLKNYVPVRFRIAGRLWCGGARATHWGTCQNRVTASKTKEFLKSPCFFRSLR